MWENEDQNNSKYGHFLREFCELSDDFEAALAKELKFHSENLIFWSKWPNITNAPLT